MHYKWMTCYIAKAEEEADGLMVQCSKRKYYVLLLNHGGLQSSPEKLELVEVFIFEIELNDPQIIVNEICGGP